MNNKREVVPLRTRKGSIYQKGTNEVFKISRSKFSNFLDCRRCFYLHFDLTLVPYKTNDSWVKNKIIDMKKTLVSKDVPELNKYCEKCTYLNTGKQLI